MRAAAISLIGLAVLLTTEAGAFEVQKTALFMYLHEVKPVEEEAASALEKRDYATALRKYREALRGYEGIWKEFPDLSDQRPRGVDRLINDSIETCKKVIEEIKDKGEAQDAFYQQLEQAVRVNFEGEDICDVAKSLTFLTDVNVIVDETVFNASNGILKRQVTVRSETPISLRTIISRMCQEAGLAYSIEKDHVFISTRVKLDQQR
ncbi:MAG: hypothetical protein Kow0099_07800 [Candidatus Abyssubacteria bacterium]